MGPPDPVTCRPLRAYPCCAARSGCGRGRLLGRNRPVAATRRWRARERFVATDAVVVELRADYPGFHPLVPKRPVGVLLAVAHGQIAVTPSTTRAVTLRHVRFVRVRRISAGNRSRKHKRRSTTQYRSAMASELELHFDSLNTLRPRPRRNRSDLRCYRCYRFGGPPLPVATAGTAPPACSPGVGTSTERMARRGKPIRSL